MSFNGSGTYVPPTGQPVATGTVIQSSAFNTLVTDIGNTFNNVLPRDGQAAMAAPLKIIDGTSSMPGIAFNSEASSGIYRPVQGTLALVVSGVESMRVNNAGRVLIGATADDGTNILQVNGAAKVIGALTMNGNATVGGTLGVTGNATTGGTLGVTSNATIGGTLGVTSNATFGGTLAVTGATTVYSTLTLNAGNDIGISLNGGLGIQRKTGDALGFLTASQERMRIMAGGNVLIGSTADDGTNILQVNGSAKVSGNASMAGYSFFGGATNTYSNYGSQVTVSYVGVNSVHGIALKPNTSTADANAISFLNSSSTYASASAVGAIQHRASDAALNLIGTWQVNGSPIAGTNAPTIIKPTIKGYVEQFQSIASSAAITISPDNGTLIELSIAQNTTITLPAAVAGISYTIIASYTGAYSLSFTGGTNLRWAGGTAPNSTSVNAKSDKYVFTCGATYTLAQDGGRNF
jgi:hypothetical protein